MQHNNHEARYAELLRRLADSQSEGATEMKLQSKLAEANWKKNQRRIKALEVFAEAAGQGEITMDIEAFEMIAPYYRFA